MRHSSSWTVHMISGARLTQDSNNVSVSLIALVRLPHRTSCVLACFAKQNNDVKIGGADDDTPRVGTCHSGAVRHISPQKVCGDQYEQAGGP